MIRSRYQRALLREFSLFTLLFLGLLLCLLILIDLFFHTHRFGNVTLSSFILYYFYLSMSYLPLFNPIAFILSTIKVISEKNRHFELLAWQMGHGSLLSLCLPLYAFVSLFSITCLLIEEKELKEGTAFLTHFKIAHGKHKSQKEQRRVHHLLLPDGSRLFFKRIDREKTCLYDLFWIKNEPPQLSLDRPSHDESSLQIQEIWHCEELDCSANPPIAYFADRIVKNSEGYFERGEQFQTTELPGFILSTQDLTRAGLIFRELPLLTLLQYELTKGIFPPKEQQELLAALYYRTVLLLLPLIVVTTLLPLLTTFRKAFPLFLFTAVALSSYLILYTLIQAGVVLAETGLIPPLIALATPPLLFIGAPYLYRIVSQRLSKLGLEGRSMSRSL